MKNRFLIFVALLCVSISCHNDYGYFGGLDESINKAIDNNTPVKLKDLTSFDWDRVYFIGVYQDIDVSFIQNMSRKALSAVQCQRMQGIKDIVIFTKNDKFVKYTEIYDETLRRMGLWERYDGSIIETFRYGSDLIVPYLGE